MKTVAVFLVTLSFYSCNKLKDFFSTPEPQPLPEFNNVFGGPIRNETYAITKSLDGSSGMAGYTYSNDGDVNGNKGESDAWVHPLKDK